MTDLMDVNKYCLHGTGHEGCCCDLKHIEPDEVVESLVGTIESLQVQAGLDNETIDAKQYIIELFQADKKELMDKLKYIKSGMMPSTSKGMGIDSLIAKHSLLEAPE